MDIVEEINELRREVAEAEREEALIDGRLSERLKLLKEKFNVSSVEEAEGRLKEEKKRREELNKKLEEEFAEIKREYSW